MELKSTTSCEGVRLPKVGASATSEIFDALAQCKSLSAQHEEVHNFVERWSSTLKILCSPA